MKLRRLVFAGLVALIVAVTAARISASACFPLCGLYTPWDIEYYIFNCFDCPPNAPEG